MSVPAAARELWRRAPFWRWTLVAATAATVVAATSVVSLPRTGNPSPSPSCPAGQQLDPATGACAAPIGAGQATNQALPADCPVPGGGATPANVQPNVVMVTPAAPSADTMARITAFESRIDAAQSEQREGESCSQMTQALKALEPADLAVLLQKQPGPALAVLEDRHQPAALG